MRRFLIRLTLAILLLAGLVVGAYFYAQWQGERDLQEALAELDAKGPWRWEDLVAARPELAEADDVRALIMDVHRQVSGGFYNRKSVETALSRPPNGLILPDDVEPFTEAMKEVEEAVVEARKLARLPGARVRVEWPVAGDQRPWPDLEIVQRTRATAHLLQCASAWYAQQGDLDAALECCLAMRRLAGTLQDEPMLLPALVRIALEAIALGATERALAQGQPSATQLAELQRAWEELDLQKALTSAFRGERACCHRIFAEITEGTLPVDQFMVGQPDTSPLRFAQGMFMLATVKQSHAWMLRHMTELIDTIELPPHERMKLGKSFDKTVREAPGLARMLVPASFKVMEAHRRSEAKTACAIAALAAERFRRDQPAPGRWPKSLDELCPKYLAKVPLDPCSGHPLGYRATGDGVVFYSIGPESKLSGRSREDTSPSQPIAQAYEFRLWDVNQRRKLIADP